MRHVVAPLCKVVYYFRL